MILASELGVNGRTSKIPGQPFKQIEYHLPDVLNSRPWGDDMESSGWLRWRVVSTRAGQGHTRWWRRRAFREQGRATLDATSVTISNSPRGTHCSAISKSNSNLIAYLIIQEQPPPPIRPGAGEQAMATINDNALSSSGVNGPTGISSASDNPPKRYNMSSRSRLSFDYDRFKTELIHISPSASPTDQGHHMSSDSTSAASLVFNIAELLELILLSLPGDTTHEEISSARTILLCRTTSHTWHDLIKTSTPVRQRLYLSTNSHASALSPWQEKSSFPPARTNPWTPNLLLNRRSWGSAYPFDNSYSSFQPRAFAAEAVDLLV